MFCQRLRKFVFAGALLVMVPFMARAEEAAPAPSQVSHNNPAVTSTSTGNCGTTTVKVCEVVPVQKEVTRTTYKQVTKEVMVTEHKWETVSETKTKQVTEYKKVTEMVQEPRTTTCRVPVWETKTEMQTKWKWENVTETKTRMVDKGHWECREVPAGPSIADRLSSFGGHLKGAFGHKCSDPCADPCATNTCSAPCPRTKTVKCWVPCKVCETYQVCSKKLVKECVPVCKQVCTYKCETKTEMVNVCKVKCVPECKTVTYTECKKVCVPVQVKKCITTCEPVCEKVMVTVNETRWVEKQVPVANNCNNACSTTDACCGSGGLFSRLKGRLAGLGHAFSHGCKTGCEAASCCK